MSRKCPKCGAQARVIRGWTNWKGTDTFRLEDPYHMRKLKCDGCGYEFTTYEISKKDFMKFVHADKEAEKVKQKVYKGLRRVRRTINDIHVDDN